MHEDQLEIPAIKFKLSTVEQQLPLLVKQLCEPLFILFDFAKFDDTIYRQIALDFANGRIT